MTTLVDDGDGRTVCDDCLYHCPRSWPCEVDGCHCPCRDHTEPLCPCEVRGGPGQCVGATCMWEARAKELDDRPPDKLAAIAGDVDAGSRPEVDKLVAERFQPPPTRRCRSCGAPIFWATTRRGKAMPVDAHPVDGGNLDLSRTGERVDVRVVKEGAGTHRSHYVTCPHADQWRPRRGAA